MIRAGSHSLKVIDSYPFSGSPCNSAQSSNPTMEISLLSALEIPDSCSYFRKQKRLAVSNQWTGLLYWPLTRQKVLWACVFQLAVSIVSIVTIVLIVRRRLKLWVDVCVAVPAPVVANYLCGLSVAIPLLSCIEEYLRSLLVTVFCVFANSHSYSLPPAYLHLYSLLPANFHSTHMWSAL